MVVSQHTSKPFAAVNLTSTTANLSFRIDDLVFEPLVISLAVVMNKEFANRAAQQALAEENQSMLHSVVWCSRQNGLDDHLPDAWATRFRPECRSRQRHNRVSVKLLRCGGVFSPHGVGSWKLRSRIVL